MPENGWAEYKRLVVDSLNRLESAVKELDSKIDEMNNTIFEIKVKVALFSSGVAIVVTALTSYIIQQLSGS